MKRMLFSCEQPFLLEARGEGGREEEFAAAEEIYTSGVGEEPLQNRTCNVHV